MKRIAQTSIALSLLTLPVRVAADCVKTSLTYGSNPNQVCPSSDGSQGVIISFLIDIIKFLGGLVGLVVVLMIIIGAVQYTTAGSNPQAVAAAKGRISNALIALVLYILMFGILQYLIPGGVFTL